MKNKVDLLDQFDCLISIEPSAEWNDRLMQRLDETRQSNRKLSGSNLLLYTVLFLLLFNLFSFSKHWLNARSQQNVEEVRLIASEYLIPLNSSNN